MTDIRWVGQEDQNGCVAACLAMLTGRTYRDVADELPAHSFQNDGLNYEIADALLAGWGYAVARKYVGSLGGWSFKPFAAKHLCDVDGGTGPHAVVMLGDGTVLDPADPEPKRLKDYRGIYSVAAVVPLPRPLYIDQHEHPVGWIHE